MKVIAAVFLCALIFRDSLTLPPSTHLPPANEIPGDTICGKDIAMSQVVGGKEALRTDFPWMVLLEFLKGKYLGTQCAGSVITSQYVVTAAHCLDEDDEDSPGKLQSVILGVHNRSSLIDCQGEACEPGVMKVDVEETLMHPGYVNRKTNYSVHDIALIRLAKKVPYTPYIHPVCLPSLKKVQGWISGHLFFAAGWGRTGSSYMSETKRKVGLNFVEKDRCSRKWLEKERVRLIESQICAGGKEGNDTCHGDSGGPLMTFQEGVWFLEGIVSFGHKCAQNGWSSIYTDVSKYEDWIKENMRPVSTPLPPANEIPGDTICGRDIAMSHVLGGKEALRTEFPWMVLLEYHNGDDINTHCAGSLISNQYVITAAHCLDEESKRSPGNLRSVILGVHNRSSPIDCQGGRCEPGVMRVDIEETRMHPDYVNGSDNSVHDIALIRLANKVPYTPYIHPVCLPSIKKVNGWESGRLFFAAGWGRTSSGYMSETKQKVGLNFVEKARCSRRWLRDGVNLTETQICAGGKEGKDTCQGDSGGPLMSFQEGVWVLGGIVSFGHKCGQKGWPSIYTNVIMYDDWIKENMRP
ncbi:transmembrane protease serine 9-like [Drosophila eugracilis]|uniref:transmembrane protease serine 9-like n=1 Tax=Drosophila eugracilis TaxID=29029 RepID=UPI0007E68333|nr:transmembrane protease serine 9-like [Drosophila eugracilis]